MDAADTDSVRIRLRRARPGDADDLARAWTDQAEVYAEIDPSLFAVPDEQGLGDWLVEGLTSQADPERRLVLVADVDGRATGFIIAAVVPPHPAAERQMQRDVDDVSVRIEALAVRRAWWHHGVGSRLTTAAEDWARNRGATVITAQAHLDGPARGFFAARGYAARAVVHARTL
jgi:GNAT superfamily N-acetyltransferase